MLAELNYIGHYVVTSPENSPLKNVLLGLDLVILRFGNIDAWFNYHFGSSGCRIPRFENYALIPFFNHAPEPEVVAEVLFNKSFNLVKF